MTDMIPEQDYEPKTPMSNRNQLFLLLGLLSIIALIARFAP